MSFGTNWKTELDFEVKILERKCLASNLCCADVLLVTMRCHRQLGGIEVIKTYAYALVSLCKYKVHSEQNFNFNHSKIARH